MYFRGAGLCLCFLWCGFERTCLNERLCLLGGEVYDFADLAGHAKYVYICTFIAFDDELFQI